MIWKEIKSLFLELDADTLAKGVTISVYQNSPGIHFYHLVEPVSKSKRGTPFSHDFDVETLKKVIDIAEENGIVVEQVTKNSYYKFIYYPNWR